MMIRRAETWQHGYERSRYLASLPTHALAERLKWLFENIATVNPQGQLSAEFPAGDYEKLWIAFTHTVHEFNLRGQAFPDGFLSSAQVPQPSYPLAPSGLTAYQNRRRSDKGQLFKFGHRDHLNDMLNRGDIKLRPGSYYKDPSLNHAVGDDELHFTAEPRVADIYVHDDSQLVGSVTVHDVKFTLEYGTDFYVFCMTRRFSPRLFADFDYNACLIIYDCDEFIKRFQHATEKKLGGWSFFATNVTYVDPQNTDAEPPIIPFSKELRFLYQQEYRFVIEPPTPKQPRLPDIDLQLGPCSDIAELISIS
jgi:hypothetical protein